MVVVVIVVALVPLVSEVVVVRWSGRRWDRRSPVVDTGTLVVNGPRSRGRDDERRPALSVLEARRYRRVNMVGAGLVQSSENCTMAYTRAASNTRRRPRRQWRRWG